MLSANEWSNWDNKEIVSHRDTTPSLSRCTDRRSIVPRIKTTALRNGPSPKTAACPTLQKHVRPTRLCGVPSAENSSPTTRERRNGRSFGRTPRRPTSAITPSSANYTDTRWARAFRSVRSSPCSRLRKLASSRISFRRLSSNTRSTTSDTILLGRARATTRFSGEVREARARLGLFSDM